MNESLNWYDGLEIFSKVLIRCFGIGVLLLLFWFGFFILGGDIGYKTHSQLFQISRHEYDLINYYGMGFVKACNLIFFLFPYLAIQLVLKRKNGIR